MVVYVIDTSSLIKMKEQYPSTTFPSVWQNMEKLCKNGKLIGPLEVLKEIEEGDDELKVWAKKVRNIFIKPDKRQTEIVKDILNKHPYLAKPQKIGPNADPWIIALAKRENEKTQQTLFPNIYVVVTEESKTKAQRVPGVCRSYRINCINILELFEKEGWKF